MAAASAVLVGRCGEGLVHFLERERGDVIGIFRCPLFRGPLVISISCTYLALFSNMCINKAYNEGVHLLEGARAYPLAARRCRLFVLCVVSLRKWFVFGVCCAQT